MELVLEKVRKEFVEGERRLVVIDGLTHTFSSGKRIAILGRSGIGKSTLLHLLAGIDSASSGKILLGNTELAQLKAQEPSPFQDKPTGFVFQFHPLLPEFTALENVTLPLLLRGDTESDAASAAEELLVKFGLSDRLQHRPGKLSGGEQQRVAVARALACSPGILLGDEPTGNLDPKTAARLRDELFHAQEDIGNTLIVVTHSREFASAFDEVVVMEEGGSLVPA